MKITLGNEGTAKFLDESGLLFKINNEILHPLGLALCVAVDDYGHTIDFAGMIDVRTQEPAGWIFDEETMALGLAKVKKLMAAGGEATLSNRLKHYGWIIQPK